MAINSLNDLVASLPAVRYDGNPIIAMPNSGFSYVAEPCSIVNPLDSSQLVMLFVGGYTNNGSDVAMYRATASVSSPKTWTVNWTPVMSIATGIAWESNCFRINSVWVEGTTIYLSYTGSNLGPGQNEAIGIASSADGGVTWTRYAGNPVFTKAGSEITVSQGSILKDGSTYRMYFSYRTATATLPGIKVATATSKYGPWTRGIEVIGKGASDIYFEWHQILKLGIDYVLVMELGTMVGGNRIWTVDLASTTNPDGVFSLYSGNPIFSPSGTVDAFDEMQVATGAIYDFISPPLMFYQGGNNAVDYNSSTWKFGIADFILEIVLGTISVPSSSITASFTMPDLRGQQAGMFSVSSLTERLALTKAQLLGTSRRPILSAEGRTLKIRTPYGQLLNVKTYQDGIWN